MKVAFFEYFLNIRGTSKAIYDYAHYNETLLGNESMIITQSLRLATHEDACADVYEKFQNRFPVFFLESYENMCEQIQAIVDREKPDVLYMLWKGDVDHVFRGVKTLVHTVFDPRRRYGDSFCVISEWLNVAFGTNYPVIPHIVPVVKSCGNLRDDLGIPADGVVFGRYGGVREFDHPAAQEAVIRLSGEHPEIYFLFMNTACFLYPVPPNVIFLEKSCDTEYNARFIDTCDAMLYARTRGETFGLSIAEFSVHNKPIFAPRDAPEQNHRLVLKENAYWYTNADDLCALLVAFRPCPDKDWNMYKAYSPEKVMATFQEHLTALVRPPKLCYVTTFLSPSPPKILDLFLSNAALESCDLVVFVETSLFHLIPRVLPPNVIVKEIDAVYLEDNSVMWKRLGREEQILASAEFQALVKERTRPLGSSVDLMLGHTKVDFVEIAMAMAPSATHFAWIDAGHSVENITERTMVKKNVVVYDIVNDINPAVDGQVLYTLQKAPEKVRGSFFSGSRAALLEYRQLYHQMHQALHDHGVVIDDEAIAMFCYLQKPELFNLSSGMS